MSFVMINHIVRCTAAQMLLCLLRLSYSYTMLKHCGRDTTRRQEVRCSFQRTARQPNGYNNIIVSISMLNLDHSSPVKGRSILYIQQACNADIIINCILPLYFSRFLFRAVDFNVLCVGHFTLPHIDASFA